MLDKNNLIKFIQAGVVVADQKDIQNYAYQKSNQIKALDKKKLNIFLRNDEGYQCDESSDDCIKISRLIKTESDYISWLIYGSLGTKQLQSLLELSKNHMKGIGDISSKIYLLDPDINNIGLILQNTHILKSVTTGRLLIFTGQNLINNLNSVISQCHSFSTPYHFLISNEFGKEIIQNLIDNIAKISINKNSIYENLKQANKVLYKNYKFDNSKKEYNILFLTTIRSTFINKCTEELALGFSNIGHKTYILREPTFHDTFTLASFVEVINKFKPDLIIQIDHFRHEFDDIFPTNIPFITWIQDNTEAVLDYQNTSIDKNNIVFVLLKDWIDVFKKQPRYENISLNYLPCGVNIEKHKPLTNCPSTIPVSYISHLGDLNKTFYPLKSQQHNNWLTDIELKLFNTCDPSHQCHSIKKYYTKCLNYLESLNYDELANRKNIYMETISYLDEFQFLNKDKLVHYLFEQPWRLKFHINLILKTMPLIYLDKYGIDVHAYGNSWDQLETTRHFSKGPVNSEQLIQNTCSSIISLNISPGASMHMRALEIIACGGFMLSRKFDKDQSPITDFFNENEEVILFENEKDLISKVKFYLNNEKERNRITQNALNKVKKQFSYNHTASTILNKTKSILK